MNDMKNGENDGREMPKAAKSNKALRSNSDDGDDSGGGSQPNCFLVSFPFPSNRCVVGAAEKKL